ncbi:MAG TPA: CoB--CoM heterodisulfide reductase iron-sulfur subunit B family protein [Casimicrobiaceae bacterium]|nr:CoB--CoM heterodisulfide reductase iron-sulfur subunit B family protein [Casimicrobiaceae bacterium]
MKIALFVGCCIPARLPAYEVSARAVLGHLGVDLVDVPFDCCGYRSRSISGDAFVFASARNLALAGRAGVDVLTLCTCGFGTLKLAARLLEKDPEVRGRVERALAAEGLVASPGTAVEHLLWFLARRIGVDVVAAAVRSPRSGIRVAAQYGCHALRPSDISGIDDPMNPKIFETLIEATGAEAVDWPLRLECCGDPVRGASATIAHRMARAKLDDAKGAGAQAICTACPHCHLRFDSEDADAPLPRAIRPLLLTQLLGLAMGLEPAALGMTAE